MKFALLAGGKGTRLSEITRITNKPLIPIGDIPILFHVAVRYLLCGAKTIDILIGHESERFKSEFQKALEILRKTKSVHPNLKALCREIQFNLVETNPHADTFERIIPILGDEPVMVTYGDTLTNVQVDRVIASWLKYDPDHALTCVTRPRNRFSSISWDKTTSKAKTFNEKQGLEQAYVGCGFIILPSLTYADFSGSMTSLEIQVLPDFVRRDKLVVYEHQGLWHPIDYLNDLERAKTMYQDSIDSKIQWLDY